MTAKVNMLYVILENNTRIDDVEPLMNAIAQMKNVLEVKTNIASLQDELAYSRVRQELGQKLIEVVYPEMVKK